MEPDALLHEAEAAIKANDQARACALVHRYGELGRPARPVFDLMLRYAISEDGALHAEKYYRTVTEEFATTRPAFRWRQLAALARVTASEYGFPAPGVAEARAAPQGRGRELKRIGQGRRSATLSRPTSLPSISPTGAWERLSSLFLSKVPDTRFTSIRK